MISSLQQKGHFVEARNLANVAEIESNDLIINEWSLRALQNLDSIEFWAKCWDSLKAIDPSLESGFKVFHKFLSQVSSLIVKCFLIFKCLIASQNFDNQRESSVLETTLWKCVLRIESDCYEKSHIWSGIWSDIIAFIKSNKNLKPKTSLEIITTDSSTQEIHKTMNNVMEKLLNNSCVEKAQEVGHIFNYNHPDLDIVLVLFCFLLVFTLFKIYFEDLR